MRASAATRYDQVPVSPFTLFFSRSDPLTFFNYAIPDEPTGRDLSLPLDRLREEFERRDRIPRFEFIERFAPELPAALAADGFGLESRLHLMVCTPATFRPAEPVGGLSVDQLHRQSPIEDVRATIQTQRLGFDLASARNPSEAEAIAFLANLEDDGVFLARIHGEAAGAGSFTGPIDGVTEIAGIATLERFRRRGIASAVTSVATRAAFARGVEIAVLTAADERAGRVYERIGFEPLASMMAYIQPKP